MRARHVHSADHCIAPAVGDVEIADTADRGPLHHWATTPSGGALAEFACVSGALPANGVAQLDDSHAADEEREHDAADRSDEQHESQ
jgi:hypothetical protein